MSNPVEFYVEDMTCGHCERTIREALAEQLPGASVQIDLGSHRVQVDGDAARAEAALREAGYTPVLKAQ
jgi:copper chaperone